MSRQGKIAEILNKALMVKIYLQTCIHVQFQSRWNNMKYLHIMRRLGDITLNFARTWMKLLSWYWIHWKSIIMYRWSWVIIFVHKEQFAEINQYHQVLFIKYVLIKYLIQHIKQNNLVCHFLLSTHKTKQFSLPPFALNFTIWNAL